MARGAEGVRASAAEEHSHRAAAHALPVDKIVSVLFAGFLAVASCLQSAALAHLFCGLISVLLFQCLCTVLQATKVRNFALLALVECALVHGELLKFSEVDIAFGHDSTLDVEALFFSLLQAEAFDCLLVIVLFVKLLAKERNIVIEFNFLLAAGAVKIAE